MSFLRSFFLRGRDVKHMPAKPDGWTWDEDSSPIAMELRNTVAMLAAVVQHYAYGEARLTQAYLEQIKTRDVEMTVEPDGTRVIRVVRA